MDILRDFHIVIFSLNTIFITFFYKSLAGVLFKLSQSSRGRKPEVALDFLCLTTLWLPGHFRRGARPSGYGAGLVIRRTQVEILFLATK